MTRGQGYMLIYFVFVILVMMVVSAILGLHELAAICLATPHCKGI